MRGLKAGMLTFFLGPPLGGAAAGFIAAVTLIIVKVANNELEPSTGEQALIALYSLLVLPLAGASWSFFVAAAPAAVAAAYVSIRVGITSRLSWTETIGLSIVCLAFMPSGADRVLHYDYFLHNRERRLFLPPAPFLRRLCCVISLGDGDWFAKRACLGSPENALVLLFRPPNKNACYGSKAGLRPFAMRNHSSLSSGIFSYLAS